MQQHLARSDWPVALCFHGIGTPGRPLEPGEDSFWISEDQFVDILGEVRSHRRPVILTFDDSNESDHELGLPRLLEYGMTAEFFVLAGRIGCSGSMDASQLRNLTRQGMSIGTHGMHHRKWSQLTEIAQIREELVGAAIVLSEIVGQPVRHAACPNGAYNRRVLSALRRIGYERVYSVDDGITKPGAWLQTRHTVHAGDSARTIRQLLDNPDGSLSARATRSAKSVVKRWR